MSFRNVYIASPSKLSCKNNQLIIEKSEKYSVPMEDISCLLIEDLRCSITAYTLSKLTEMGVTTFVCDDKHLPTGVLMPMNRHSRHKKIIDNQLNQSRPFIKRLWKQIVTAKIRNQSKCLEILEIRGYEKLYEYSKIVKSGDADNIESRAAAYYFKKLFGKDFNRSSDNIINSSLNYGYALFRGSIARQLATYGFETCIGINHYNEQNNFNLADDLIEPFRPVVDLYVAEYIDKSEDNLTPQIKQRLFNLFNCSVLSDGQRHSVTYAIERTVQSLSSCFAKRSETLILPDIIPIEQHAYE